MLNVPPWNKLPLVVQWVKSDYQKPLSPPLHMPIVCGPIEEIDNEFGSLVTRAEVESTCNICNKATDIDNGINCIHKHCSFHLHCLSEEWLGDSTDIVPLSGACPRCKGDQLWGDMVRLKKFSLKEKPGQSRRSSNHWTNKLTQNS